MNPTPFAILEKRAAHTEKRAAGEGNTGAEIAGAGVGAVAGSAAGAEGLRQLFRHSPGGWGQGVQGPKPGGFYMSRKGIAAILAGLTMPLWGGGLGAAAGGTIADKLSGGEGDGIAGGLIGGTTGAVAGGIGSAAASPGIVKMLEKMRHVKSSKALGLLLAGVLPTAGAVGGAMAGRRLTD